MGSMSFLSRRRSMFNNDKLSPRSLLCLVCSPALSHLKPVIQTEHSQGCTLNDLYLLFCQQFGAPSKRDTMVHKDFPIDSKPHSTVGCIRQHSHNIVLVQTKMQCFGDWIYFLSCEVTPSYISWQLISKRYYQFPYLEGREFQTPS